MTEEPVISNSPLLYQIAIFVFVNIWGFMAFEVAQYRLVILFQNPMSWIGWSNLVLLTMLPVLGVCTWRLKDRVQLQDPAWDFKIREVSVQEFEEMLSNYNAKYTFLLSSVDYFLLIFFISCYFLTILLPFYLMNTIAIVIQLTPILIAFLAILTGLLFSYFLFKLIPNSASSEFPYHKPKRFQKAISYLIRIPGIFWAGVRVTIGEAGGYYTIRNPCLVARIEGIEGTARLEANIDSAGNIEKIDPIIELEEPPSGIHIDAIQSPFSLEEVVHLIRKMLQVYISQSGGDELLEDVIDEIDSFLHEAGKDT